MPEHDETTHPPATSGRSGRQRLRDALLKPSREQAVVAVLLAVLGFAAVTQVHSYQVDDTYAGYRQQDLIDVLSGLTGTSQRAEAEISRLERRREELQTSTSAREAALAEAQVRADTLDILAGTVPVTGPGLRITIEEASGTVDIGALLDTIQELRTAGAEAMEFNEQVRVVAQTSLEDGVGGVYVDDTLLTPPYVIDVIGEPSTLAGGLSFVEGPTDQLEDDGAEVLVQELRTVDIESVRSVPAAEYAVPAPEQ